MDDWYKLLNPLLSCWILLDFRNDYNILLSRVTQKMSEQAGGDGEPAEEQSEPKSIGDHLDGLESGAGCAEIWERLSEQRRDD